MPDTATACTSYQFSAISRALANASRALDLTPPSFRSPPKEPGQLRTIRRRPNGTAVVAVAIAGRALEDVAADLLAGVYAAHGIRARTPAGRELADAVAGQLERLQ